jgi:hypothetical protein
MEHANPVHLIYLIKCFQKQKTQQESYVNFTNVIILQLFPLNQLRLNVNGCHIHQQWTKYFV